MKTLGGSTFVWNAIEQDYSIIESLECLYELCDQVSVAFGGTDGTLDLVLNWIQEKIATDPGRAIRFHIISLEEWASQQGREKLSYFSNIAIEKLDTDYFYYQQADEITHENCFGAIRKAIESEEEAYMVSRVNLWGSPFTALNVAQYRKPVSTEIVRLAKRQYRCVGDAESLGVPECNLNHIQDIRIYHNGFVRDKHKHLVKIRHIQEDIFLFPEADVRIKDCPDGFDPWAFGFTPMDVAIVTEVLPKFMITWAQEREQDPFPKTESGYANAKAWLLGSGADDAFIKRVEEHVSLQGYANGTWWVAVKQYQLKTPS